MSTAQAQADFRRYLLEAQERDPIRITHAHRVEAFSHMQVVIDRLVWAAGMSHAMAGVEEHHEHITAD